ncbi:MAG: DUF3368 domain-containing protein [Nanoarchaeota archaeon]|nr:DUF3368 domain-containing protein [Nanoarchaeota archaeon]
MIVSNTSPLIHLAKAGKLDLLRRLFKTVLIPVSVHEELMKQPRSTETILINEAIKNGWIRTSKVHLKDPLRKLSTVAKAELEVIALAIKEKKIALLDDKNAVQIAEIFRVGAHGTLFVILQAVKKRFISKKEAINAVNKMMENEFYITSDVYALFLQLLG